MPAPRIPRKTSIKKTFTKTANQYVSTFQPYFQKADIFINGIFYDKKAPAFFTLEIVQHPDFRIRVIGDITCDIMPGASVPATIRPTHIDDPVFGFDPKTGLETAPYQSGSIDVMAIDNLPSELPRDASVFFGEQLMIFILPELIRASQSDAAARHHYRSRCTDACLRIPERLCDRSVACSFTGGSSS